MTRVEKGGGKKGGVDKFVFSYLKKKKLFEWKVAEISAAFIPR